MLNGFKQSFLVWEMSWCQELFLAEEAARAVQKPQLGWNKTVLADAGICQFMTSDITAQHNFRLF